MIKNLRPVLIREEKKGKRYEINTHRNWKNTLMVVVPDEYYEHSTQVLKEYLIENPTVIVVCIHRESEIAKS